MPGSATGILLRGEANYASFPWIRGSAIRNAEESLRRQAELGRLLSAAAGYRVVARDGTHVGWLDHVRYEQHADHPDEIVVRRRGLLLKRHRAFPFSRVETEVEGEDGRPAPRSHHARALAVSLSAPVGRSCGTHGQAFSLALHQL
jgi:hypothetical protein